MQFAVYRVPGDRLVLDLQSDIPELPTRVVAPLVPHGPSLKAISILEPIFEIGGRAYALHTAEMAAVPAALLRGDPVISLQARDYEIRRALDMLFSGF